MLGNPQATFHDKHCYPYFTAEVTESQRDLSNLLKLISNK